MVLLSKWTTTTTTATNQWPWCSTAHGGTASSSAGRMHIVRAQAVELDWMWQRRSDATTSQTDARVRQGGAGGRVHQINRAVVETPFCKGRGHRATAGWAEGIWHGGTPSGKLEDGAAEMLHFTFIATDCCQCCLCECVAWAGDRWSDCNAG